MKKLNKFLALLLIMALILPGFTFANDAGNLKNSASNISNLNGSELKTFERALGKFDSSLKTESVSLTEQLEEFFKDSDEVRIIVELKTEPAIVQATRMNTRYGNMSNSALQKIEQQINNEQEQLKKSIELNKVSMQYLNSFNTTFNGFSGMVKFGDIAIIEKLPQVNKVYLSNEYEKPDIKPDMDTSKDMIGTTPTWNLGIKGEGTVIAIIDSGIDYSHRDMVLSEETNPKLNQDSLIGKNLLGQYYTEKVPYGYNYYDLNNEVRDLGPSATMHGMHVAGIAGANGDSENGGIKGVAPEAQLLAMKVFSNDPLYSTTFSDIYLIAIEEAVKLGADVLNLSLGSVSSFYIPNSAEDIAITNATNNGIVCTMSAGNAGSMTYGWTATNSGYPWRQNPDIGVVGAPGLNKDTIQVASIENTHRKVNSITYTVEGADVKIPAIVAGEIIPSTLFSGAVEFVDGGSGHQSELTNVAGKVALIVRGGLTPNFADKILNAQNAGAIGVIVRNHQTGGEDLVSMVTPTPHTIPAVFIGYNGGMALMGLENKQVSFTDDMISIPNPNANKMVEGSSWGVTPSLEIKPEITAPGSNIYSTFNNDDYGIMSGTSMASPHVAGGSALVLEYIKEHPIYSNLELSEQTRLAKVLLMNTANIIYDVDGYEYSPRRQGAGLMNLYGAVTTPVRLVDEVTNEAKVTLKDFDSTVFTMSFKAINDSDTDVTYNVDTVVLKDYIHSTGLNLLSSDYISANIESPETITVPANGEITFEVTVDFGSDDTIYRNMFIEGFVSLTDPSDENASLSIPYVGFYGDWSEPKILDGMRFIDSADSSYFNRAGMLYFDPTGSGYYYTTPHIYMNPGTIAGYENGTDNIIPYLSFMRNAEYVNYNILDSEGNNIRTIYIQQLKRKNYINGGLSSPVGMITAAEWNGKVRGEVVPDGDYQYEILAKIHYEGAEPQSKKIPITIDTAAPMISEIAYNQQTKMLSWNSTDAGIGILGFMFNINGVEINPVVLGEAGKTSYELDMSPFINAITKEYNVEIISVDQLFNSGVTEFNFTKETVEPHIYLYNPQLFEIFDTNQIEFVGYVANLETLEKVLINNTEADVEPLADVELTDPSDPSIIVYSGPAYKFTKTLTLEDGYQEISIEAVSSNGDSASIVRRFFVDTTAPELDVQLQNINQETKTAELQIHMTDNLGYIELYQEDSQIYKYDYPLVNPEPADKTITHTVNLKAGDNYFTFTLNDGVGNSTVKSIIIGFGDVPQEPEIINLKPSRDTEIYSGESVTISFNAPTGGAGYYKILLPSNLAPSNYLANNNFGTPMVEESTGFYTATWTAPQNFVATNLIVELVYVTADGTEIFTTAEGKITVKGSVENMPENTIIIGNEAFDIDYLNSNAEAQEKLLNWYSSGKSIYIKLQANLIVDQNGKQVNMNIIPDRLIHKDIFGTTRVFEKQ